MIIDNKLQLRDVQSIVEKNEPIQISAQTKSKVEDCYSFLESFAKDQSYLWHQHRLWPNGSVAY